MSLTTTVAEQLAELLLLSVTVRITIFPPRLAQVKFEGLRASVRVPQANAVEPLSMAAAVTVTLPAPFRITVRFWHKAVGRIVSSTVTVAVQVDELPEESVTVSVTAFAPMLRQVNAVGFATLDWMPQISEDPLSICAALILAFPSAFN